MFAHLVRHTLIAARRDRLMLAMVLAFVVIVSLSIFVGSSAVTEKNAFASVFTASGLRIAGVLGLVLFVVFHVRRSFDSQDMSFLLSRPVPRLYVLLSMAAAFSILALVVTAFQVAGLMVINAGPQSGIIFWGLSIVAENIVMVCAALFFSMILTSAVAGILATGGLYILGRMMGEILGILDAGMGMPGEKILRVVMEVVSVLTPRLDLMGQSSWLVYGADGISHDLALNALQCAVFAALALAAAAIDLKRRIF